VRALLYRQRIGHERTAHLRSAFRGPRGHEQGPDIGKCRPGGESKSAALTVSGVTRGLSQGGF